MSAMEHSDDLRGSLIHHANVIIFGICAGYQGQNRWENSTSLSLENYPRFVEGGQGNLRGLLMVALRSQGNWRWEGPLGTPLGLVHWKRASSPVEAGTAGYL